MTLLDALLLAVIQGLTEFLPVSSSGHMVLAKALLGVESPAVVWEVALHLGTLIAVFAVFRREILRTVTGFCRGLTRIGRRDGWKKVWKDEWGFRMGWYVIIGTVPAIVMVLLFESVIEQLFSNAIMAMVMLFVTGEILWLSRSQSLYRPEGKLRLSDSVIIGIAQALALFPGISRSGSTICAGLFRGVERNQAVRFSFLLSIPAILGAGLYKVRDIAALPETELPLMLTAVAVSAIVGYVALRVLLGAVRAGKLYRFAYYCWAMAFVGTVICWSGAQP